MHVEDRLGCDLREAARAVRRPAIRMALAIAMLELSLLVVPRAQKLNCWVCFGALGDGQHVRHVAFEILILQRQLHVAPCGSILARCLVRSMALSPSQLGILAPLAAVGFRGFGCARAWYVVLWFLQGQEVDKICAEVLVKAAELEPQKFDSLCLCPALLHFVLAPVGAHGEAP